MGCCVPRPQKEELIKYFWASLPIRKMSIKEFKNCIKNFKRGKNESEDIEKFKEFFLNENYLVFGSEQVRKICFKIFEEEVQKKNFNHFLFSLALLCQWNKETKDETANKRYLNRVDEYLGTKILKYNETSREWYIPYNDLLIIYRRYVEMTTLHSIEPVLSLSEVDEKALIIDLRARYSEHKIEFVINERLSTRSERVTLSTFIQNDLDWLTRDDNSRQALLKKEAEGRNQVHTVRFETHSNSTRHGNNDHRPVKKAGYKHTDEQGVETRVESTSSTTYSNGNGFGGVLKSVHDKQEN
jgi:hypothetical protein